MPRRYGNEKQNVDVNNPDYKLTLLLLAGFQKTWNELYKEAATDPVRFSRLSLVALTQLSALVAVDIGMTEEQFTNVCRAQFLECYKQAPKFG